MSNFYKDYYSKSQSNLLYAYKIIETVVCTNSSNWNSSFLNNTSAFWCSVYSTVNSNSAYWNSAYTNSTLTSSIISSIYSIVNSNSASWEPTYNISNITNITTTYNILTTDNTIVCNNINNFIVTLPDIIIGQYFNIKNINIGKVIVEGKNSDLIDGELNQQINQWENLTVQAFKANNWIIL